MRGIGITDPLSGFRRGSYPSPAPNNRRYPNLDRVKSVVLSIPDLPDLPPISLFGYYTSSTLSALRGFSPYLPIRMVSGGLPVRFPYRVLPQHCRPPLVAYCLDYPTHLSPAPVHTRPTLAPCPVSVVPSPTPPTALCPP